MSSEITKIMSVRELAELSARSGSIDSRYAAPVRAAEGSRLHRLLQKSGEGEYEAEVALSAEYVREGVRFVLSGRADGIIRMPDGTFVVDEIKTTMRYVSNIAEDDYPAHWAQAACYARMYCERESLPGIAVRLTYYQTDTGELRRHMREYTLTELTEYIDGLLDRLVLRARWEHGWRSLSRETMRRLPFPFGEFRPGQRKLAGEVYRCARDGDRLFAAAPTGTGKTISALFPAVRALGEGLCEKVFYLTAKETARTVATDAARAMLERGMRGKAVVITAKDKICPLPERRCDPEHCKYADGHFDRVDGAVLEAMQGGADFLGAEEILKAAEAHTVCPFELSLDLSSLSDIIICDYNYVFDPRASLKRFFTEGGEYLILGDEAHNLPARAREMYSCEMHKSSVLSARRALGDGSKPVKSALTRLNKALLDLGRAVLPETEAHGELVAKERPAALDNAVKRLVTASEEYLATERNPPQELLELYWGALEYMRCAERWGDNYAIITRAQPGETSVRLFCADPSEYLAATLSLTRAAVFFSATLFPLDYYSRLLGGGEDAKTLALPSPFPRENFLPLIADTISTRYRDRESSLGAVAELIYECWYMREGNYIAFFPSYKYMDDVFRRFTSHYPAAPVIRQERTMDTRSRDEFLRRFEAEESVIGFCVMGGVFAEGVDFAGDRAIGVIIAGTGLPGIDVENEILRDYCELAYGAADTDASEDESAPPRRFGVGYDYAYVYPGMNRVLQAAGRVIRSPEDRGIALLIDDRFSRTPYPALFPGHWAHRRRVRSAGQLREALGRFWNK